MSESKIRPATLRDARGVAQVHAAALLSAAKGLNSDEPEASLPLDKRVAYWREAIEYAEPQVLVATVDGDLVGFVGFDRSRDPRTPPTQGEIWALHVLERHWGQGHALALWDAAREGLIEEGCSSVSVWVPLRNERALRFFELAGFKRELNTARTTPVGTARIEEIRLRRALS